MDSTLDGDESEDREEGLLEEDGELEGAIERSLETIPIVDPSEPIPAEMEYECEDADETWHHGAVFHAKPDGSVML